ncbi:hypothetical protein NQ314_004971 [Rhamnusium bicolor]|uniref:Uncharacterized protein n=1 Tax=Rhamnusium bicolor TaxID=1586634 RepID=A0AAV8ZKY5_9CUCU|nr:hypothetical protein NQ314_004971 [Rhamnusium bicolor]
MDRFTSNHQHIDENTKQQKLKTLDDVNTSIGYKVKVKSNIDKKLRGNIQSELEKFHFKNVTDDGSSRNNGVVVVAVKHNVSDPDPTGVYIIAVVAGISAAATVGLIAVGIGWYK